MMGGTLWVSFAEYDLVVHYDTSKNVIRFSVDGNEQLLFSSSFAHSVNGAVPASLTASGKWAVFTHDQLNIQFREVAVDTVVTTCPRSRFKELLTVLPETQM
jgi:hypothetical protein